MSSSASVLVRPAASAGVGEMVNLMRGVMRCSFQALHPTLADEGITKGQFWALHVVSSLEAASLSTVARSLGVSPPTACSDIDQLEAAGLVERHRSKTDRRAVHLALTPRGRKVERRVWGQIGRLMSDAARDLTAADVATTVRVFQEIYDRLSPPGSRAMGRA
jgi:DNA-binding MarR family transcriptional regulator